MVLIETTLSRQTLHAVTYILLFLSLASLIFSVVTIATGIHIWVKVGSYLSMISINDGYMLPVLLSGIGTMCLPSSFAGIVMSRWAKPSKADLRMNKWLFWYAVTAAVISLAILIVTLICVFHSFYDNKGVHYAILKAMKEYATNVQMKSSIDILQITFKCCGSKSYKEWFYVSWFDPQLGGVEREKWPAYENGNESEIAEVGEEMPQFVSDDAPFSCCSSEQLRPCVHHGVLSRSPIYRYNPQRLGMSLWKSGCHKALQRADRHLMRNAGALLFCFFILQVCLGAGTRLLQTGLLSLMMGEGPFYRAWVFGSTPEYRPLGDQLEPGDSSDEDSNYWEGERPWATSPLRKK